MLWMPGTLGSRNSEAQVLIRLCVFRRYNIVAVEDMREAATQLDRSSGRYRRRAQTHDVIRARFRSQR